jgi:hypothetical protein
VIGSARQLPREFSLAASCCIWPPSERRTAAIREAATQTLDWDRFLRVVIRQRVAGLVHDGLNRAGVAVPPGIAREIAGMAARDARQNLHFTAECCRIQHLLDDAGVANLFVKGVTLAQLAYGNLGLKHSWDIDLLVMPEALPRTLQILEGAGYRAFPPLPPVTDKRYKYLIAFAREYVLFHDMNSLHIEIHWRLASNVHFLPGISALSPTQIVRISERMALRTLESDDLFSYLCLHGAEHRWSRLKWIADLAALIAGDSRAETERRLQLARKVNAEHCVAQAILLCDRLFGLPELGALAQRLRRSLRYRFLERTALQAMTYAETEPDAAFFERVPTLASHFLLGHGSRFAVRELWNKLNGPYHLPSTALPAWLWFLYPIVNLASFIKRCGRTRPLRVPSRATPLN